MERKVDIVLRIVSLSLIIVGILFLLLMVLGLVHSPELELLSLFVSVGIFIEIGRLEEKVSNLDELKKEFSELKSKFELLWKDFEKRKKL